MIKGIGITPVNWWRGGEGVMIEVLPLFMVPDLYAESTAFSMTLIALLMLNCASQGAV